MKFRKKLKEIRRPGNIEYKKQQSYHYSAKRRSTDRLYGRKEYFDEEDKNKQQQIKSTLSLLPSLAAIVVILFGILYILHVSPSVSIRTEGDQSFIGDKAALQAKADSYMRESILNRTKLTFDEQKLQQALENEFPEFTSITVNSYIFRQKPVVTVRFAEPTLLLTNGTKLYIISETGDALADITTNKPDVDTSSLPLIQDQTSVEITIGKQALTSDQVKYIKEITFQTDKRGIKTQSIILIPGGAEINVRYAGLSYYVKYNLYEDPRKSSGTFIAAKEDFKNRGVTPSEYIDVRLPERAYIK